ncbi:hypothetical protein CLIB1444_04S02366 [[Candida] jaroonii]|uniref:Uncharacterized protein n=1 Tax=[Candida] jaroonii TaxID=467808 RepID=A0ACA9Y750_9ASCO|nr:hypothetical protein CLIB1444_04S02366 [[Candida] jaroonii]
MSKTPISSPKIPPQEMLPSTPPSNKKGRLSSMATPEKDTSMPFTPSLKRNSRNLGTIEQSPYGLLKTPKLDSDDEDIGASGGSKRSSRYKFPRTPNYFSPGKKLFDDEKEKEKDKEREDINNITLQLKGKLTNALEKLNQKDIKKSKFEFTELTFNISPTRKKDHDNPQFNDYLKKANLNLQNMTNFDNQSSILNKSVELQSSPVIKEERDIEIPLENSAHNALKATINRKSQHEDQIKHQVQQMSNKPPSTPKKINLPPINPKKNNEQDAAYSLMSLSSPQQIKFSHSRNQSLSSPQSNNGLVNDSVTLPPLSPTKQLVSLPPISGLIKNDDETDIEEDSD